MHRSERVGGWVILVVLVVAFGGAAAAAFGSGDTYVGRTVPHVVPGESVAPGVRSVTAWLVAPEGETSTLGIEHVQERDVARVWLEELGPRSPAGAPQWATVLDEVRVPRDPSVIVVGFDCTLGSGPARRDLVVVAHDDLRPLVAWRVDLTTRRFAEIDAATVTCPYSGDD